MAVSIYMESIIGPFKGSLNQNPLRLVEFGLRREPCYLCGASQTPGMSFVTYQSSPGRLFIK